MFSYIFLLFFVYKKLYHFLSTPLPPIYVDKKIYYFSYIYNISNITSNARSALRVILRPEVSAIADAAFSEKKDKIHKLP